MKYLVSFLFLSFLVGCGTSNFTKQKFTNLKKIKVEETSSEVTSQEITKEFVESDLKALSLTSSESLQKTSKVEIEDRNLLFPPPDSTITYIDRLKEVIEHRDQIYIYVNKKEYRLVRPKIEEDGSLTGTIIVNNEPIVNGDFLKISEYDNIENNRVKIKITDIVLYQVIGSKVRVVRDENDTRNNYIEWHWLDGKQKMTGEYDNKDFIMARRFFRLCLLLLGAFIFFAILVFVLIDTALFIPILVILSLIYLGGMTILTNAGIAMRRFYNELGEKRFRRLNRARSIRTLIILGLMLFGCFPFLIPFFICWWVIRARAKKSPTLY